MDNNDKDLELSKAAWKMFLNLHAHDCDIDAVVDEIVDKTVAIKDAECQARAERIFKEIEELLEKTGAVLQYLKKEGLRQKLKR